MNSFNFWVLSRCASSTFTASTEIPLYLRKRNHSCLYASSRRACEGPRRTNKLVAREFCFRFVETARPPVCSSVRPSVRPSIHLSVYPSVRSWQRSKRSAHFLRMFPFDSANGSGREGGPGGTRPRDICNVRRIAAERSARCGWSVLPGRSQLRSSNEKLFLLINRGSL